MEVFTGTLCSGPDVFPAARAWQSRRVPSRCPGPEGDASEIVAPGPHRGPFHAWSGHLRASGRDEMPPQMAPGFMGRDGPRHGSRIPHPDVPACASASQVSRNAVLGT